MRADGVEVSTKRSPAGFTSFGRSKVSLIATPAERSQSKLGATQRAGSRSDSHGLVAYSGSPRAVEAMVGSVKKTRPMCATSQVPGEQPGPLL